MNIKDNDGRTALDWVSKSCSSKIKKLLLDYGAFSSKDGDDDRSDCEYGEYMGHDEYDEDEENDDDDANYKE